MLARQGRRHRRPWPQLKPRLCRQVRPLASAGKLLALQIELKCAPRSQAPTISCPDKAMPKDHPADSAAHEQDALGAAHFGPIVTPACLHDMHSDGTMLSLSYMAPLVNSNSRCRQQDVLFAMMCVSNSNQRQCLLGLLRLHQLALQMGLRLSGPPFSHALPCRFTRWRSPVTTSCAAFQAAFSMKGQQSATAELQTSPVLPCRLTAGCAHFTSSWSRPAPSNVLKAHGHRPAG